MKTESTDLERERVASNLLRLRDAVRREVGWMPTAKAWVLPITAFAVGLAIAVQRRTRARRRLAVAADSRPVARGPVDGGAGAPRPTPAPPSGPRRMGRG